MRDRLPPVRAAYGARAQEYVDAVGRIDDADPADLALLEAWTRGLPGPVLDVGCGPGQWTHHLAGLGVDVEGVDPVPEFIEIARRSYPDQRYRVGRAEALDVGDGGLGGVLAWYSLIHTMPDGVDVILQEFARSVRRDGGLALGFFTGAHLEPFDHAVTTAYRWPIDELRTRVEAAGFTVTHSESRELSADRIHGAILARRK